MSKTKIIQNSMVSGVLSKTLRGRVDINKYYSGVEQADNVVIMAHGGVERRNGLKNAIQSSTPTLGTHYFDVIPRILYWDYDNNKTNYVIITDSDIIAYQDDVPVSTVAISTVLTPDLTQAELDSLDYVQIEREIFVFLGTRQPLKIVYTGATAIAVSLITFDDMPIYDFTNQYAGVKERYIGDGVETTFVMLYSGSIFSVYVGGVKYTRVASAPGATQYTFDSVAQSITLGSTPAANVKIDVISGYVGLPYDSNTPFEDIWSNTRGWPKTATIHQNRLVLGGSTSKPSSVWQSVVSDFLNFNTGNGSSTDGIFDTLDTVTYNEITNLVSNRSLQVFSKNAEFYNQSNPITPANSSWQLQSPYGNIRIPTAQLDGATYYIDRHGKELRQFLYSFNEDGYTSVPVSLLASDITNNAVDVASINGTSSTVSNYIYVVNGDGTVAVLNVMRSEEINGWSKMITSGNIKRAVTVGENVYFVVERSTGYYFIEKSDENYYMDHSTKISGVATRVEIQSYLPVLEPNTLYDIVADGSYLGTGLAYLDTGKYYVDLPRASVTYAEVGIAPSITVKTMPLTAGTSDAGVIVNERKRVIRVILNLFESLGVAVDGETLPDRAFVVTLDQAPTPYTGIKEIYLLGYSRTTQITISQDVPLGFTLLQLDHEVEY